MTTKEYVQDYVTTKYPLAKYLKTLDKESFSSWVYEKAPYVFFCLQRLGSSWATKIEEVENTMLELIEFCLEDLKKDETKQATYMATGMIRIELTLSPDWEGEDELVVYPGVLLDI